MDRPILPRTIIGYVIGKSGIHQLGLAALSAAVFGLSAVPLELQRRIVNDAIKSGATRTILWLAAPMPAWRSSSRVSSWRSTSIAAG